MADEDLELRTIREQTGQTKEDEPVEGGHPSTPPRNPSFHLYFNPHTQKYQLGFRDPKRRADAKKTMNEFWAEVRKRDPGSEQNRPINPLPYYDPKTGPKPMSLISLLRLNRPEDSLIIPNKCATDPIYAGDVLASIVLGLELKYGKQLNPVRYQLTDKPDGMLKLSIYYQNSDLHVQINYNFDKRLAENTFTHDPNGPVFVTHLREDLKPCTTGNPQTRQTHIESLQMRHITMLYFLSKLEAMLLDGTTPRRTLHATYRASMTVRTKNNRRQELGRYIISFPLNADDGKQISRILPPKAMARKSIRDQLTYLETQHIEQIGKDFHSAIQAQHASLNSFLGMYNRKLP